MISVISVICLVHSAYTNYQRVQPLDGLAIINWFKNYYWILLRHFSHPFSLASSWLYVGIPLILLLTWLKPAIKRQKLFDKAIACDFVWMFIHALATAGLIYISVNALEDLVAPQFKISNFSLVANAPPIFEIIIGYLLVELFGWFNHLLRHKIPVLWLFHEVHHSQNNMNPFSLFRVHPVDYLVSEVIIFLPVIFFENTLGIVVSYLVVARFQDALSHSNIKSNFGPLRFIFVTPQSHRVHHSVEPEFFDLNYGVTLCIWDRIFGTHSHSDHCYPETGIKDQAFPLESRAKLSSLPAVIFAQLYYPFKKAIKHYWRY